MLPDLDLVLVLGLYLLSLVSLSPAAILKNLARPGHSEEHHLLSDFPSAHAAHSKHTQADELTDAADAALAHLSSDQLQSILSGAEPIPGQAPEDDGEDDKRAFHPWSGKRVFQPWNGKRAFNPWSGKRAFNPWSGKRDALEDDEDAMQMNGLEEDIDDKRAFNPWSGKRAFDPWSGKRGFDPWSGKRAFNPWSGKRAFNPWSGKRAFNPWNGKRVFNAWKGKRSDEDLFPAAADDEEDEGQAMNMMKGLWDERDKPVIKEGIHESQRAAFNPWQGKRREHVPDF